MSRYFFSTGSGENNGKISTLRQTIELSEFVDYPDPRAEVRRPTTDGAWLPWRATIRLAMQSGTLVPAARKVMPMMTSGIPSVKPITVTWDGDGACRH